MSLIQPVPAGSIYIWCYQQGLRGVSWEQILSAIAPYGIKPRKKDYRNWADGVKNRGNFTYDSRLSLPSLMQDVIDTEDPRTVPDFDSYPLLNCDSKKYEEKRWVPCNANNMPMVKWGEIRCTLEEARNWPRARYLAENLKGCRWIVLDFDVDHDKPNLDLDVQAFGLQLLKDHPTQALYKPGWMGFHLTYWTDKEIKSKHLTHVNIDICGNGTAKSGQLRYFKTKKINDVHDVSILTNEVWSRIQEYSFTREVFRKRRN